MSNNPTAEDILLLCLEGYRKLPKTVKPRANEWTVLAAVVQYSSETTNRKVVSMGCGTKCIGKSKLCCKGLILNDSHAEVMARRGLLRYFYRQLQIALLGDSATGKNESIFQWCDYTGKFKLNPAITFHFLSTQTPCGDACILCTADINLEPIVKKLKCEQEVDYTCNIGAEVSNRVYTGAKLLGNQHKDAMLQRVGVVRTKPGRGERTLSMSCSDKLAKWQLMGVQGALIDFVLDQPIYFETMTFGGESDINTLERAIWLRFKENTFPKAIRYTLHKPAIRLCQGIQSDFKPNINNKPSPNSLVWCNVSFEHKPLEISVNGKRQGITTKQLFSKEASLKISKYNLFKEFINVLQMKKTLFRNLNITENEMQTLKYSEAKNFNKTYQQYWNEAKINYFKEWTKKPKFCQDFTLINEK